MSKKRTKTEEEILYDYYRQLEKEFREEILYEDSYGQIISISEKDKLKIDLAKYLIDRPSLSIRKLSREFGIPKSTVWDYLQQMNRIDDDLYVQCRNIMKRHKR